MANGMAPRVNSRKRNDNSKKVSAHCVITVRVRRKTHVNSVVFSRPVERHGLEKWRECLLNENLTTFNKFFVFFCHNAPSCTVCFMFHHCLVLPHGNNLTPTKRSREGRMKQMQPYTTSERQKQPSKHQHNSTRWDSRAAWRPLPQGHRQQAEPRKTG